MKRAILAIGLFLSMLSISSLLFAASATLNFQDNSNNETGFTIQRQLNGGPFANLANLGANVTSYVDSTLAQGTVDNVYCWRVFAFNATLVSAFSNVACLTVPKLLFTVPNVVGQTQAAATAAITTAGLTLGTVTTQSSPTVPSGSVISQNPAAGTALASGSPVNLVVSSGSALVSVPNVVGQTQAAATSALTAAGLKLGTVTQQSSATVAAGNVISENPAAGSSVAPGSAVNLVVSTGPAPTVPIAPSNLTVSALSSSELKIDFRDRSNNELGFHVERRGGNMANKLFELDANTTSMTDSGLPPRTRFDYRASAFNDGGSSAATAWGRGKTLR